MRKLTIMLPEDLYEWVRAKSFEFRLSMGEIVRRALRGLQEVRKERKQ